MSERRMSPGHERAMEENWDNIREAFKLLDLIDAEFRSDPMSVQCFDARIVERVKYCLAKRKEYERKSFFRLTDDQ